MGFCVLLRVLLRLGDGNKPWGAAKVKSGDLNVAAMSRVSCQGIGNGL